MSHDDASTPHSRADLVGPAIIGLSFEHPILAREFLHAAARMRSDEAADIVDAVAVTKDSDGTLAISATLHSTLPGKLPPDPAPAPTKLGEVLLGNAGGRFAGLNTGSVDDDAHPTLGHLEIPERWIIWFTHSMQPTGSTVVVLLGDGPSAAFRSEIDSFGIAEVSSAPLSAASVDLIRAAIDAG